MPLPVDAVVEAAVDAAADDVAAADDASLAAAELAVVAALVLPQPASIAVIIDVPKTRLNNLFFILILSFNKCLRSFLNIVGNVIGNVSGNYKKNITLSYDMQ